MGLSNKGVPVVIPSDVWQPLMEIRAQLDSDCPGAPTPIEELLREIVRHYERCDIAANETEEFCKRAQTWKRK
ncbi:MAG: hypothetical protein JRM85_08815 [Nitrososphaerota archaeon]|jgi:hypothetical protein|nr:hypothetical protein [Nitrososphaerota archaeon]MDG6918138.1 hypothetical protein [Nitrososphaerota archaeon]